MKKLIIYLLGTFFGAGYFPKLPGTFTSALTTMIAYYLLDLAPDQYISIVIVITLAGVYITGEANKLAGEKDKPIFSLDEVAGQLIAFIPLCFYYEHKLILLALGFGLFRFFDIVKPGLIKQAEAYPGGWGVMLDDVISGFFTALCLQSVILFL
ncbi:phosphatidylglycerophosphatase A [Candidatus Margulisiibacteriota bacterium]